MDVSQAVDDDGVEVLEEEEDDTGSSRKRRGRGGSRPGRRRDDEDDSRRRRSGAASKRTRQAMHRVVQMLIDYVDALVGHNKATGSILYGDWACVGIVLSTMRAIL